ncbi:MAG: hypothetical protein OJF49_001858 [Ktedonobacterales bacterium]|jgi:pimeloyl-ACP methyl ester carboxylesterase|nr:MAG: hypothetical protein OJF49_001858 [Ktedonobacterales bacterium]
MATPPSTSTLPQVARETPRARLTRRAVALLLILTGLLTFSYTGLSAYLSMRLVAYQPLALTTTPAALGLDYRDVTFPAREDGVKLRGWLIPGLLPDGRQTLDRTIITVHGARQNRTDPAAGLLDLSAAFVHAGFAVLTFDARGHGESPPAPFSLSYFEQRDVLGAVDFLLSGKLPYPSLGHPRVIGGWGVSMGANSLLLAAAQESRIAAIVADSAYPAISPILEREIPKVGGLPSFMSPGVLLASRAIYGIDFYGIRPGDVVASLAPRPVFFIQGGADTFNPPSNLGVLTRAAQSAPNANVQSWLVPGAAHAQAYHVAGQDYINRVVSFYTTALGPDASAA